MKIKIAMSMKLGVFFMFAFFVTSLLLFRVSYGEDVDDCGFTVVSVPTTCAFCHGAPPTITTHTNNHRCFRCHGQVVDDTYEIIDSDLHLNGTVNYAVGCTSCHGWDLGTSPPQTLSGECSEDAPNVTGHTGHRRDPIPAHQTNCSNCHTIPLETWDIGHIDGVVDVQFDMLATANDATPVWNGTTCSGVYCHGATLSGGSLTEPSWGDTSSNAKKCGACHEAGPSDCSECHPTSVGANHQILLRGTHINGAVDVILN